MIYSPFESNWVQFQWKTNLNLISYQYKSNTYIFWEYFAMFVHHIYDDSWTNTTNHIKIWQDKRHIFSSFCSVQYMLTDNILIKKHIDLGW